MTQCAVDLGFAPVPDDTSEEVQPFATSRTRWSEVVMGSFSWRWYLIRRTWVSSNSHHPHLVEISPSWWAKRKSRSDSASVSDHECKRLILSSYYSIICLTDQR